MPRLGAFVLSNYFAVIYVPVYSVARATGVGFADAVGLGAD